MFVNFVSALIKKSRATITCLVIIVIAGFLSYYNIPKESQPDVKIPNIIITVNHEGISPEDGERLLVKPIERSINSIEGIENINSYSTHGHASIMIEFDAGFDSNKALHDVKDRVDEAKKDLPEDADEPVVKEIDFSQFPILYVILQSDMPELALNKISKEIRDHIEALPNVLKANIRGIREESVEIILDSDKLENHKLSLEEVFNLVRSNHVLVAAGTIINDIGAFTIKVPGLLSTVQDIKDLPIVRANNAIIKVADIADVRPAFKDTTSIARVNGKPAILILVSKRTGKNIIETIDQVKYLIEKIKPDLPENLNIGYSNDESYRTIDMLTSLNNNIITAIFLVVILISTFIGIRSSLLIGITIPSSFLFSIFIIKILGFTLNNIILFGLIMAVGILVDTAIVVVEMADRKITEGKNATTAYIEAVDNVKWSIISSTATTIIVFMPLLFWPGIVGQFMKYLPITLIITLVSSLIVALVFSPVLGSIFGKKSKINESEALLYNNIENGVIDGLDGITGKYINYLKPILDKPVKFVSYITIFIIIIFMFYIKFNHGTEFFPNVEPDFIQVKVRSIGNMSIYEKNEIVQGVEERLKDLSDDILITSTNIGEDFNEEDVISEIFLDFKNWRIRRNVDDIVSDIRARIQNIPGVKVDLLTPRAGPPVKNPIDIGFSSRNLDKLNEAVNSVVNFMKNESGFVDIRTNQAAPQIEWEIKVDREKAALFNIDMIEIGNYIKMVTNGLRVTTYRPDTSEDEIDIVLRLPEDKRNIEYLDNIKIVRKDGNVIPIINFIEKKAVKKINTIYRYNSERNFNLNSNVLPGYRVDSQIQKIKKYISDNNEQFKNISIKYFGEEENSQETKGFLMIAFITALIMMSLILLIQFNSFYYVFVIMSAIFFSTAGVLISLLLSGRPFGVVMCGLGIISLSGIVVNNNIILIDTFIKFKDNNFSIKQAMLLSCAQRLRPILLTAGTTILGLMPMVLKINFDFFTREIAYNAPSSQWWTHLSTTVAGGLAFATILTLFFTPCLIVLEQTLKEKINLVTRRLKKKYKKLM